MRKSDGGLWVRICRETPSQNRRFACGKARGLHTPAGRPAREASAGPTRRIDCTMAITTAAASPCPEASPMNKHQRPSIAFSPSRRKQVVPIPTSPARRLVAHRNLQPRDSRQGIREQRPLKLANLLCVAVDPLIRFAQVFRQRLAGQQRSHQRHAQDRLLQVRRLESLPAVLHKDHPVDPERGGSGSGTTISER